MLENEDAVNRECPQCIAVVICNEIVEDKWSNNKSLFGLFNSIQAIGIPTIHPRMFILASLTDGRGEWPIVLEIRSASDECLFGMEGKIRFDNPLAVHDLVVQVLGLPIPETGEYCVQLLCGGKLLGRRRFSVISTGG